MTERGRSWGDLLLRGVRTAALLLVVLAAVASVAAVLSGRYQARPVLSGSMRPGLPVGGVVVTERVPISSLKVRDVIVFHRPDNPGELVVHRIIALRHHGADTVILTQGDNNQVRDPWHVTLQGATAYRAQFSVPWVGYLAIWWHRPATRDVAFGLAAACALAALALLLLSRRSDRAARGDQARAQEDDAALREPEVGEPGTHARGVPQARAPVAQAPPRSEPVSAPGGSAR
jgi:signal peptidase I